MFEKAHREQEFVKTKIKNKILKTGVGIHMLFLQDVKNFKYLGHGLLRGPENSGNSD